jgi:TPR repeat protein
VSTPQGWTAKTISLAVALLALALSCNCRAQLAVEEVDGDGILNPSDFSWRYYVEEMNRFPDRLGIICVNGYELDKTGDHVGALAFLKECARRGNAQSMVYLAVMIETGHGSPVDPREAANWLRRSAETGYALGQYHYGVTLLLGRGVERNLTAAHLWLAKAAAQGESDAAALIASDYDLAIAADPRQGSAR